jgi:hypothetical protein
MQLKSAAKLPKAANTRRQLMAASCALLGAAAARSEEARMAPADSGLLEDWSVDSALAYYHEDGRIQAIEPVVNVAKLFADGQALNFNVTFDSLQFIGQQPQRSVDQPHSPDIRVPIRQSLACVHDRSRTVARGSELPG